MRILMNTAHTATYIWQQPDWPIWRYDASRLALALAGARQQQGIIIGKAQAVGLSLSQNEGQGPLDRVIEDIWLNEAMATAAIEGERLDASMVRSSIMRKLGLAETGLASRHVDGLIDVMHDASQQYAQPLDADRLCRWQSALFPGGTSGIRRIVVGQFRDFAEPMQIISGKIGHEKVHFTAPASSNVPLQMASFLQWFNSPIQIDGIIRAAIAHLWFETIHPFEDGNGRIGRAIIDMALAQDSGQSTRLYSLSRQLQENRAAYYDALNQAQTGTLEITPWLLWFIQQFEAACKKSVTHIDNALQKAHFWASHAQHPLNERQRKTLQKLLDAGDGGFLGGLTSEKHSKITGASKATATRDLTDLLQNGLLFARGTGKATKYYINVAGWLHGE